MLRMRACVRLVGTLESRPSLGLAQRHTRFRCQTRAARLLDRVLLGVQQLS